MITSSYKENKLIKIGTKIAASLQAEGFGAYFVGGAVRDTLLGRKFDNLDIATNALPDQVEQILNKASIRHKSVGKRFGTILAVTENGPIEITTFRSEDRYSDHRHPDQVEFIQNMDQDAKRRDFTINALYLDPARGQVIDKVNGH